MEACHYILCEVVETMGTLSFCSLIILKQNMKNFDEEGVEIAMFDSKLY